MIGIGDSGGPWDVAANKHRYLAQGIWPESHPEADSD